MLWRKIIGTAGALGLVATGAFALASPASAEEADHDVVSDCDGLTFTVTPNADHRAWRAVIDGKVVWVSGDWEDDNLGKDHQKLVDEGWTKEGPFTVHVKAEDAKDGPVNLEWWHVNPQDDPNGWTHWPGGEWTWERPEDCEPDGDKDRDHRKRFHPTFDPDENVTQPTCDDLKGIISIPDDKGVQYKINGKKVEPGDHLVEPGKYLVTAKPDRERHDDAGDHKRRHEDKKHRVKEWKVKINPAEDCPKTKPIGDEKDDEDKDGKLPVTGTSTGIAAGAALTLLGLGGAMYALARRRRFRFTA